MNIFFTVELIPGKSSVELRHNFKRGSNTFLTVDLLLAKSLVESSNNFERESNMLFTVNFIPAKTFVEFSNNFERGLNMLFTVDFVTSVEFSIMGKLSPDLIFFLKCICYIPAESSVQLRKIFECGLNISLQYICNFWMVESNCGTILSVNQICSLQFICYLQRVQSKFGTFEDGLNVLFLVHLIVVLANKKTRQICKAYLIEVSLYFRAPT